MKLLTGHVHKILIATSKLSSQSSRFLKKKKKKASLVTKGNVLGEKNVKLRNKTRKEI